MQALKYILTHRYLGPTAVSMTLSGSYIGYRENVRYHNMCKAFKQGNVQYPSVDDDPERMYVKRPDIEALLTKVLQPENTGRYYVIRGEVGSGKTRTIVEIIKGIIKKNGKNQNGAPIYVLATKGQHFVDTLSEAVNFKFDEHLSFKYLLESVLKIKTLPAKGEHDKLARTLQAMENAASRYRRTSGKPAVVVIDGIDWLQLHMPGAIERLQEKAKLWADSGIIKVVFVSSDERTEHLMQSNHSDWSRAAAPIYFTDLNKNQAYDILNSPETEPIFRPDEIDKIFSTVGYRVLHLLDLKQDRKDNIPLQRSIEKIKAKERTKLRFVPISPQVVQILSVLQAAGGTGIYLNYFESSDADIKVINELAAANIAHISTRPHSTVVRLESKLTNSVVKELLTNKKK